MIVVTGGAGFIGSNLIQYLNQHQFRDVVIVDTLNKPLKTENIKDLQYSEFVEREVFLDWLDQHHTLVQFVFHLGARTDTTEQDVEVFNALNLHYTQAVWKACIQYGLPLVYASSAATYGAGELGYDDNEAQIPQLQPLNPYGQSKQDFDVWALQQDQQPYFWVGLKFFNVYGPREFHKHKMASVIFHAYHQIRDKGYMNLFKSHRSDFKDGEQQRDFIFVNDLVQVCYWLMHNRKATFNGIYNLGTGQAETFLSLAEGVFEALDQPADIRFIDTPLAIRDTYQYFTEANMTKLKGIGYPYAFTPLKEGIKTYVRFLESK